MCRSEPQHKRMKTIDPKKILKKVKDESSDRHRVTLYLSKTEYGNFQKACEREGVAASKVVEEFMSAFAKANSGK